jgi:hypothetical protein
MGESMKENLRMESSMVMDFLLLQGRLRRREENGKTARELNG